MEGKIAVITGATGGIGKVVCKYLIANGYIVYAACRSKEKEEALRREIASLGDTSGCNACNLLFFPLDLKSFSSVKKFCSAIIDKVREREGSISLLINNAGAIFPVYQVTEDGYESTMQVNYLSGKEITETLLPYITGKIINTVSCTVSAGKFHEPVKEEPKESRKISSLASLKIYSNSKYMLALYTIELHKRLSGRVHVCGVDPGIVNTGIITMHRWYDPLANIFFRPFIKSPQQGALSIINAIEHNVTIENIQKRATRRLLP